MHRKSAVKQGGPFPRMCVGKLCHKVLGHGAGGMWEERLAEGLAACTKEKGWHLKKDMYSGLNYLSSSQVLGWER